jgi:NAD(P)-dependent dehydrogenase (short-subunit alcohol dehydrogenase family)
MNRALVTGAAPGTIGREVVRQLVATATPMVEHQHVLKLWERNVVAAW